MKTLLLTSICILLNQIATAQFINSISISPQQPTTTDTIYIFPTITFGSGSCDDRTQFITLNGNNISAGAIHCIGMLAVICTTTDTFKIAPLPAGNYAFDFNVSAGAYPAPCTPGILPGDSDSLTFTVLAPTTLNEINNIEIPVTVFPNPAKDFALITFKEVEKQNERSIHLIAPDGKIVRQIETDSKTISLNFDDLSSGIYLLSIQENNLILRKRLAIVK